MILPLHRSGRRYVLGQAPAIASAPIMVQAKAQLGLIMTTTSAVTTGNLVVVAVGWYNSNVDATVTDSLGTVYTSLIRQSRGSTLEQLQLFWGKPTSSGSCTITAHQAGGSFTNMAAAEFSSAGFNTTVTAGAAASAAPPTCSITGSGILIAALEGDTSAMTISSISAPFTQIAFVSGSDAMCLAWSYQTATAPYTATFTGLNTINWTVAMAAFQP